MKFALRLVPIVLMGVLATTAFGQIVPGDPGTYPSESVANSPHNLNNFPGVSIPGDQVCLPCHTPHNALLSGQGSVLWNHAETGESFTMYTTLGGTTGVGPDGPSKMCLSCHDGVTAIDSYGGTTGTTVLTGSANLDTDLSNDHPIGIEYPFATRPTEYNDPAGFAPGINNGPGVGLVQIGGVDRVECTSCHEPHNNGLTMFLRVPLLESYICLQCHIK